MANNRKRHRRDPSPSPPPDASLDPNHHQINPDSPPANPPVFASYTETPNLPIKVKTLCEIVANTPSLQIDRSLDETGIRVSTEDVEDVLKLSYAHPAAAVKFFRWSGYQLNDRHSPYAWNLIIDMLGKHCLFDAMWDAIKSMKNEGLLSLATFASVFGSYVIAGKVKDALLAFQVMEHYGYRADIVALNSLFSAICRDGKTVDAKGFLKFVRKKIKPDADTYAILLEGWEKEQDVVNARETFDEMVYEIGWDPNNFPAYDSFLNALLKGADGLREAMKVFEALMARGCYPGIRFFKDALSECAIVGDLKAGKLLWDSMSVQSDCKPDAEMYNSMIYLYSLDGEVDLARSLLDEMVFNGVFPDSQSYNVVFQYLVKGKKVREAQQIFMEMVKNEFVPAHSSCCLAVGLFIEGGDPYTAIKVWKCMIENYDFDLEETGNVLVGGLRDLNRVLEAVKYADDMLDRGLKFSSVTLARLRQGLAKAGKGAVYDELLKKWQLQEVSCS
ncbi:pentatricopeptide repeat-containing protein At5g15010, mitochondrial-like [Bidens hawaiensis]|uniref:pentatricopeptide repeat-containing protein At5g15010, mitochondrial-like n=1 Tax=Bidens hawaiensis TaxID=980011 RepID=UPI00404A60F0